MRREFKKVIKAFSPMMLKQTMGSTTEVWFFLQKWLNNTCRGDGLDLHFSFYSVPYRGQMYFLVYRVETESYTVMLEEEYYTH